ncbi:Uncharacterised protein [Burkholderia pseudomallei]|nr:Uncharacterised protein [Burkholderia pseudomallei]
MESGRHGQRARGDPGRFEPPHRFGERGRVARDRELRGAVVDRDRRAACKMRRDRIAPGGDRDHAARPGRRRREPAAQRCHAHRRVERQRARGNRGRVVAEAMADHDVGRHAPRRPLPRQADLQRDHQRLRHVGAVERGAAGREPVDDRQAGDRRRVLERAAQFGIAVEQARRHAGKLRTLAGVKKRERRPAPRRGAARDDAVPSARGGAIERGGERVRIRGDHREPLPQRAARDVRRPRKPPRAGPVAARAHRRRRGEPVQRAVARRRQHEQRRPRRARLSAGMPDG